MNISLKIKAYECRNFHDASIKHNPLTKSGGGSVPVSRTKYMGFLAGYNNINTQKVIHNSIQDFRSFLNSIGVSQEKIDQDIINLYLNHLRGRGLRNATYNLKVSNLKKYVEYMGVRGLTYKTEPIEVYGNMDIIPERDFKAIVHL